MEQAYTPNLEFEVTLWRRGDSFGTLPVGLGLKESTQQLVFYFGKLVSDGKRPWWMVAERHALLLEFFLEHKICFDGRQTAPLDSSVGEGGVRPGKSISRPTHIRGSRTFSWRGSKGSRWVGFHRRRCMLLSRYLPSFSTKWTWT